MFKRYRNSIFLHQKGFHEKFFFWLKPFDYRGFIGLVLDNDEIKPVPQKNSLCPQMYLYDLAKMDNPENVKGIHCIMKWMSSYSRPPKVCFDKDKYFFQGGIKKSVVSTPIISTAQVGLNLRLEGNIIK